MRMLASAVLVMESLVMGFAMLLAKDNHEASALIAGGVIAIALLLAPGLLKKRSGWILGSALQFLMIGYAVVVPSMAFIGVIFGGLWIAAIVVGRRGEAIRAELVASRTPKP